MFGERSRVKNVRASDGRAWIVHGKRRPVQLSEVPVEERAPIVLAYVSKRAFSRSPRQSAKLYFGLENPSLEDFERIAHRYPLFLVEPRAGHQGRRFGFSVRRDLGYPYPKSTAGLPMARLPGVNPIARCALPR